MNGLVGIGTAARFLIQTPGIPAIAVETHQTSYFIMIYIGTMAMGNDGCLRALRPYTHSLARFSGKMTDAARKPPRSTYGFP
jgi:hypothetical protein